LAKNIHKIEIIKGTGSALYGADAYSGVINIITKKGAEKEGGAFGGSNDTYGGFFNYNHKKGDFKFNFSSQGRTTNGSNGLLESDRQTQIDRFLGTNASLAPSSINRGKDEIDIKLESRYKDKASLYLRYIKNTDYGMGVGIANSIDNSGSTENNSWVTGLKYKMGNDEIRTSLDINYTGYVSDLQYSLFPKGAFGGIFTTPVNNRIKNTVHGFSTKLATIYTGIEDHKIYTGIGYEYDSITDISDERNYIQGPLNSLIPVGSMQSTQQLGVLPIADSLSRSNYYGFLQNEWTIHNDWLLIAGVRADYFSDFGLTINPRASLVWNPGLSITTKLMYGKAFRAPSLFELNTNPGVAVTGNKSLKPEEIQTVEWSIHKSWHYGLSTQLNLFWYETKNSISETLVNDTVLNSESRVFHNSGKTNAYGLEFDFNYNLIKNITLNINYSYLNLDATGGVNEQFIITAPTHQLYASINWDILPNWSANIKSNSVIGRKRVGVDTREAISDYTKVDIALRSKEFLESPFDLTFKIENLFDENVREPSISEVIPGDYPLDGRTFMGIISTNF
jgi:iron complex outermembrane receptor protein